MSLNKKNIKNYSMQGLSLVLKTEKGPVTVWLEPRAVISVPEVQISEQIKNLHKRRLIQISN